MYNAERLSWIARQLLQDSESSSTTSVPEEVKETKDGDILIISFALIIVGVLIGYCYESYACFRAMERYFPHASANMIFGFFVGLILSLTVTEFNDVFSFDPEFFFIYLLPPIIFSAGYNLRKDFFFHNFGSIMSFAFIGTTLSAFFIGACLTAAGQMGIVTELSFTKNMMLGSLISAVDPVAVILVLKSLSVDEQLKILLFGESVLNDAASVVINRVFVEIDKGGKSTSQALAPAIPQIAGIAIASMLIGTLIALFVALLHKWSKMNVKKGCAEIELAAFLLGAFLPYGIAEALGLSGICSVLFAGIMTDYYTYHHLSKQAQTSTRHIVSTLSYISELFVFIYLGMSFFLEKGHQFQAGYVVVTLLLCFLGRAISVFPLAFLLNMGRKHKLPFKHQLVLWYSGLRGPVAYALAVATPDDETGASRIIVTTTITIVAFTTLMLGGLAYPFLKWVQPPIMRSTSQTKTDTYDISNHWFNRLDRRFLRPLFGPKTRRNVDRPLTASDHHHIEMQQEAHDEDLSSMKKMHSNSSDAEPKLQLIDTKQTDNDVDHEEEEEEEKEKGTKGKGTEEARKQKKKGKADTHLSVTEKTKVDYSLPRTQAPSFLDGPREPSEDQSNTQTTWSELNTSQANLSQNLGAPLAQQKSVTPPPQQSNLDDDSNDIISSYT